MRRILIPLVLLFSLSALAQTTTTYTGTVRDLSGSVVTSGRITFQLNAKSGGVIPGVGSFVSTVVSCLINATGNPVALNGSSPCVITNNSALTPSGTSYTLCRQPYNVTPGSCFTTYANGGTVDISTLVPTPATQPNYGLPMLTNSNNWGFLQNFTAGVSTNAISSASAGNFTGTAFYAQNPFSLGTISPTNEYTAQQFTSSGEEAITGAIGVPNTSTIHQVNGIGTYVVTNSPTTMGVGAYLTGRAGANGTSAWGMNNVVTDTPGMSSGYLWGIEDDCNLQGSAGVRLWCFNATGRWTHQPTGTGNDMAIAMKVNQPLNNSLALAYAWNVGLNIDNAATTGAAIQIGARAASGNNIASQYLSFFGFDGSGNPCNTTLGVDTAQEWQFGFGNCSTNSYTMSPTVFTAPGIVQGGTVAAVATGGDQDISQSNLYSSLLAGHYIASSIGRDTGNFNHASFGFNYVGGSGSTSNLAFMAVRGGSGELTVDGNGNAVVNGNLSITGTCSGCGVGSSLPSAPDVHDSVQTNSSGTPSSVTSTVAGTWEAAQHGGADNTGSADASSILNTETTALCSITNPVRIHLAAGKYVLNSHGWLITAATATACKNMVIEGDGSANTILTGNCSVDPFIVKWQNTTSPANGHYFGPTFRHLQIVNNGGTNCTSGLITSQDTRFQIDDVIITGFTGQTYATGTISSSGSTVTGVGTTFTAKMQHGFVEVTPTGTWTTTRAEVCSITDATHLQLCSSSFPTGNLAAGTAYALPYGGDAYSCDPGTGISGSPYTQYGSINNLFTPGNLIGIHAWGIASGGCSRITVTGSNGIILPNAGSRITDSVGTYLSKGSDSWEISGAPTNNVTACFVLETSHINVLDLSKCEMNSSQAPVTTCNTGSASQHCLATIEMSSESNGHGWGNKFFGVYSYLVGTVYQFDNVAALGAGTDIIAPRDVPLAIIPGNYDNHYYFYGTPATIAGSLTSGTFTASEVLTQTTTGATAKYVSNTGSSLSATVVIGAYDASHTWVGGTSGAVWTPTGLATTCPQTGSGIPVNILAFDCNHTIVANTVN